MGKEKDDMVNRFKSNVQVLQNKSPRISSTISRTFRLNDLTKREIHPALRQSNE
jgi:hypothetical protein